MAAPKGISFQQPEKDMNSSDDVHTPRELEINGLWQFFPKMEHREGEPDPPPLGPFQVLGDYKLGRKEGDGQRFLILKPQEGSGLPTYNRYALEYPEKLIAADLVTFERRGRVSRIRTQLTPPEPGVLKLCQLRLMSHFRPVREYVIYERQAEGTWIPVEADGTVLRP